MLDSPVSERVFFENVIRENLDIGRPNHVGLIFDRRLMRTGPVIPRAVSGPESSPSRQPPSLHVDYKMTTIKQYHKGGRGLPTETAVNYTYDSGIRNRLTNLPSLREIGFTTNRRLLRVQRISHDPITGIQVLHTLTAPVITDTRNRVLGLRLGQLRSHALLSALPVFRLQTDGFANRDLLELPAQLRGIEPGSVSVGRITYNLRRLRHHGLIERIPRSHHYLVTNTGLPTAMFIGAVHDRLLPNGLADLLEPVPTKLRAASHTYQLAIYNFAHGMGLAA